MIRILILVGLGYLAYRFLKSWMFPSRLSPRGVAPQSAGQIDDIMVKDPFCETYFPKRDGVHLKLGGKDLYFCSTNCRDQYLVEHSNANMRNE